MLPTHRLPLHPGELLQDLLDELAISQTVFAKHLGWHYPKLNEIIRGKRGITPQSALDLADALGTTPDMWLNAQRDYDVWHAMRDRKPIEPIRKVS